MRAYITIVLLVVSVSLNAQIEAVKSRTFYLGDLGADFYKEVTEPGKKLLDSLYKITSIDLNDGILITSRDQVKYTSKEYLSKRNYEYITIYRFGDDILVRRYINDVGIVGDEMRKILLRYSKDPDNQIDRVSLHVIY